MLFVENGVCREDVRRYVPISEALVTVFWARWVMLAYSTHRVKAVTTKTEKNDFESGS